MLHIVLQKIKNQKWLNLCLFMGALFITAMFSCHPMLEKGADSGILRRGFTDYAKSNQHYPAILQRQGMWKEIKDKPLSDIEERLDVYVEQWQHYIDAGTVAHQRFFELSSGKAVCSYRNEAYYLKFAYLKDMEKYTDTVKRSDFGGRIEGYSCYISEKVMDNCGFVAGEQLVFPDIVNSRNESLVLTIEGICREKDIMAPYWEQTLSDFEKTVFLTEDAFDAVMSDYGFSGLEFCDTLMVDYTKIDSKNAEIYESYITQFEELDASFSSNLGTQFEDYHTKQKRVHMILIALELPCIILIYLFLYMISSRLLQSWEEEMAVFKSRGASGKQMVILYFLHSCIISAAAFFPGVGMGYLLCTWGAGTDGFLHFTDKPLGLYRFCPQMILYALAACISVVLFLTVPVLKLAGTTIVQKKKKREGKKPWWFLTGIDVILLGISGWLLWDFYRQKDLIALDVIAGKQTDPMLFLNVTLFVFACSLFCLRVGYGIVCLLFSVVKRKGSANGYAAFLQLKRSWFSHGLIGIFLMMAVSGGIVNSAMARTIGGNMTDRITLNIGADMRCKEKWKIVIKVDEKGNVIKRGYVEPDFGRFGEISKDITATRVLTDENIRVAGNSKKTDNVFFMGIHTREFGETAYLPGEGNSGHHWYQDLNELAKEPNGVIISANLARELNVSVGDFVTYTRYADSGEDREEAGSASGKVCAIVSEFPGFEQYRYETDQEGNVKETEEYLLVCNYTQAVLRFPLTPYEVWLKFSDDSGAKTVHEWEADNNITMETQELKTALENSRNEPVVQITNAMLTLSFLISIQLCAMGYLIYWLMSAGSRQTLFGIYRAMGMYLKEIKRMLCLEQIFASAFFAAAGIAAGVSAIRIFIPLTVLVYLPQKHSLPTVPLLYAVDLFEISAVMALYGIICISVLFWKVRHMHIAQTLRLGDDS